MSKAKKAIKARPPTMAMRLADAENRVQAGIDVNKLMQQQVNAHDREEGRLANENTRLSKIIEGLKEELFNKSLALANAEGKLERVAHEDAERAEVVLIQDMKLSKVDAHGGIECNGPPVTFQKAVLKYELARPLYIVNQEGLYTGRYTTAEDRPKHWVNRS